MARRTLDMHLLQDLVRLHREGVGPREVARLLDISPNTERKYRRSLQSAGLLEGDATTLPELADLKAVVAWTPPPQECSSVEDWREVISDRLGQRANARAIHAYLQATDPDFQGSYDAVKRLCRRLRQKLGPRAEDVAIPVITPPGEVAQVDFGYVGKLLEPTTGRLRKAWVFVLVLGHSRHLFAKVVFDQKSATWLRLHAQAFTFFGAVPRVLVPDNLKAAVIRAAFTPSTSPELNRSYRELARHYGCRIDPTPPYQPQKKGKVESAVKYVQNALRAWGAQTLNEANDALKRWNRDVASVRIHGSTGKQPIAVFEAVERAAMLPLPLEPFALVIWKQAKVHTDSHVVFEKRLYSVPWRLLGQQVWVRATPDAVAIYADDLRVATHPRRGVRRHTLDSHLPDHRVELRERTREHWEGRARALGDEVGEFVAELFDQDDVLHQLRAAQAVVTLLDKHPRDRANAACRRARYFDSYSYVAVRDILRKGLDFASLPDELPLHGQLEQPVFARPPDDIVH